jgi:hypothetical protein
LVLVAAALNAEIIFDCRTLQCAVEVCYLQILQKPPLSKAEKHPDFQVTLCIQNVSTNVDYAPIKSEKMLFFAKI